MTGLEQLTRISHKFRSELDAGYFERVGEGSFGYVYQAKKGGRPVAVKILKDKEADSKHIENFEREVEMLKFVQFLLFITLKIEILFISFQLF